MEKLLGKQLTKSVSLKFFIYEGKFSPYADTKRTQRSSGIFPFPTDGSTVVQTKVKEVTR